MRTVADEKHIIRFFGKSFTKITPSAGNDGSNTTFAHSFQNHRCHSCRVVKNNATKSDVNRRGALAKEGIDFWGRDILWCVTEEETTYI